MPCRSTCQSRLKKSPPKSVNILACEGALPGAQLVIPGERRLLQKVYFEKSSAQDSSATVATASPFLLRTKNSYGFAGAGAGCELGAAGVLPKFTLGACRAPSSVLKYALLRVKPPRLATRLLGKVAKIGRASCRERSGDLGGVRINKKQ